MHRLLILRHAHSRPAGPQGDRARDLSKRGHAQCADVLAHMQAEGLVPDAVVCSPASRTLETWQRICAIAPDAELHTPDGLYMGGTDAYEDALAAAADAPCVLLVGHNPTCAAIACGLDGARDLNPLLAEGRYPTASLCVARVDGRRRIAESLFTPDRQRD